MKNFLHSLLQRVRTFLIDWSAGLMNWASDEISWCLQTWGDDHSTPIEQRALLVDRFANWVFHVAYPGSDEEIEQALDGCVPVQHLSERQRAAVLAASANPCLECNRCQWVGFEWQAEKFDDFEEDEGAVFCPSCGEDYLRLRDRSEVWVPYRDHRALVVMPSCALVLREERAA